MPKRGGGQRGNYNGAGGSDNRFSSLNDYTNEHDDRDRSQKRNSTRRVSFKPSQTKSNALSIRGRVAEMAIRGRLEDDEDMGDFASSSRYDERHGSRRKGSPIPKGKFGNRKLIPSAFGWYQVTIQSGQRYSKDDVIRAILSRISPDIFIPQYWHCERNAVVFFVDDFRIAEKLQQIDRPMQMSDGFRLFTRVRSGVPIVSVDEHFREKMKLVMAKRYNAHTRALDLSRFHADPDFKDMFCGLFRTPVMSAALDIIEKNIPELEALNLNDNNITSMEAFKNIGERLPHLKILYLGDNKIPSLAHLLVLRNVPIIELVLKSNPLRQRYKDNALYKSEVRRKFPKLIKLDGEALEPQILFDVNDTSSLPQAKASFLCDVSGAEIIRQFLEQYFIIFDSDNRQPLLDAYHEQAMLSLSIPPASQAGRLTSYWKYNRNLRRIMNNEENTKYRQLKVGRLAVVSTLADWPKTQHDPQSFSVDLTLFTPKLMAFTVGGLFKELDAPSTSTNSGNNASSSSSSNGAFSDIRYFERQFVVVPAGSGFCIRNELVFITSATHSQARTFLKPPTAILGSVASSPTAGSVQNRLQQLQAGTSAQIPAAAQLPNAQMPVAMLQPAVTTVPDDATKLQMVQAMSTQSNMNLDWSRKCLEETNWDYNHAAYVFEKLHKENKIPPEAFVK